jgi:hypothetical protein
MAGKRLRISAADRDERLERYAGLRDQGVLRADAAREVGVSYSGAGAVYERWYLSVRGLPPPRSPCQRAGPWFV